MHIGKNGSRQSQGRHAHKQIFVLPPWNLKGTSEEISDAAETNPTHISGKIKSTETAGNCLLTRCIRVNPSRY